MLHLSSKLERISILSLRTGTEIAVTAGPIINPNNLKIEGFYCNDVYSKDVLILLTQDIREQLPDGFVVNDHEVLVEPSELVRLQKIINTDFQLIDKTVRTTQREKVGKVNEYATDFNSFYIQKLYVSQPLVKSFAGGNLVVDRSQINEITSREIIIENLLPPARVQSAVNL